MRIGGADLWWSDEGFKGRIDEVRIYNRALGAGEIAADRVTPLQTPPSPPVAAWAFEAGEGTVAIDSARDHDATIEGANWVKGRNCQGLEFDAQEEDFLNVADAEDLDLTEEFTIEAWVRPNEMRPWATVIGRGDAEGSDISYLLYAQQESDRPSAWLHEGSDTSIVIDDAPLPLQAWSHLAVTSDGAKLRLYVNGVLVKTNDSVALAPTGGELWIGGNAVAGQFFDGRIDEVRIYDRALEAGEIAAGL